MHSIARSSFIWLSNVTHEPNDSTDSLSPVRPSRRYSISATMAETLRVDGPHGDAVLRHHCLRLRDRVLPEVEDRRRQHGIGTALDDPVDEVLERADPAAGDHRDPDGA